MARMLLAVACAVAAFAAVTAVPAQAVPGEAGLDALSASLKGVRGLARQLGGALGIDDGTLGTGVDTSSSSTGYTSVLGDGFDNSEITAFLGDSSSSSTTGLGAGVVDGVHFPHNVASGAANLLTVIKALLLKLLKLINTALGLISRLKELLFALKKELGISGYNYEHEASSAVKDLVASIQHKQRELAGTLRAINRVVLTLLKVAFGFKSATGVSHDFSSALADLTLAEHTFGTGITWDSSSSSATVGAYHYEHKNETTFSPPAVGLTGFDASTKEEIEATLAQLEAIKTLLKLLLKLDLRALKLVKVLRELLVRLTSCQTSLTTGVGFDSSSSSTTTVAAPAPSVATCAPILANIAHVEKQLAKTLKEIGVVNAKLQKVAFGSHWFKSYAAEGY